MEQIKTSDLRLGNWLYDNQPKGFPMQVEGIGIDWIYLDFEGNEGDVFENTDKEIYPIPFSVELLSELSKNIICDGYFISIEIKDGVISLIPSVNADEYEIGKHIKYVHELQNLYHAFTGKELEIRREWL